MNRRRFQIGTTLEVVTQYGHEKRQLVEIKGDTLFVCTADELAESKKRGRDPILCGFNERFVLRDLGITLDS